MEWINVKERLPENKGFFSEYVLCYQLNTTPYVAIYFRGKWTHTGRPDIKERELFPDYWMPLPEPPAKAEQATTHM